MVTRLGRILKAAERPDPEAPDPGGDAPALRIATWNVHSCVGIDAKFSPERVAKVIAGLDADVIGLQEVGWHHRGEVGLDQFDFLARATGLAAVAGPTKHHEEAHYGNALLTRLPVREARPLDLSLPRREPRGALDVDVELGDRVVRVVVAHLGLDPWERNAQITRIFERLEEGPPRPTVLLGDLNEWRPNSPRLRRLHNAFPTCAAPLSFHARFPALRLDRVYATADLDLAGCDVVRNALTRRASDHLPVVATLRVLPSRD